MYDLIIQYWDWYLLIATGITIAQTFVNLEKKEIKRKGAERILGSFFSALIMGALWPLFIVIKLACAYL